MRGNNRTSKDYYSLSELPTLFRRTQKNSGHRIPETHAGARLRVKIVDFLQRVGSADEKFDLDSIRFPVNMFT
jgi:hypothetical protein